MTITFNIFYLSCKVIKHKLQMFTKDSVSTLRSDKFLYATDNFFCHFTAVLCIETNKIQGKTIIIVYSFIVLELLVPESCKQKLINAKVTIFTRYLQFEWKILFLLHFLFQHDTYEYNWISPLIQNQGTDGLYFVQLIAIFVKKK